MEHKPGQTRQENGPRHEGGDPATLKEDPAQVYPTGGAGLTDPANDRERDLGTMPPDADRATPKK